jgi:hypothetical protein
MPAFDSPLTLYLPARQDGADQFSRFSSPLQQALELEDAALRQVLRRTNDPSDAIAVVLPYVWAYYSSPGRKEQVTSIANDAGARGQFVMIWHPGDLRPLLPFSNYLLFRTAIDRSRREPTEFCAPPFIEDPLPAFAAGQLEPRKKRDRPTIGFCGYAIKNPFRLSYAMLLNIRLWLRHQFCEGVYEPPRIYPAARFRAKVLGRLASDRRLETRLLLRSSYRAGVRARTRSHVTVHEFYRNIIETDYTICIRGYGNWSLRLYETLACGRIPVLIDTDCGLPYDFAVDWKRYCVWVPAAEWRSTVDRILEFHAALAPDEFVEKQRECRRFWEERLTFRGFFGHFGEHFVCRQGPAGEVSGHGITPGG